MNSKYCTIYLVRHGESEVNTKGIVTSDSPAPLTTNGIKQINKLSSQLSQIKFSAIYASDIARAQQSAKIISLDHQIAITTTKLIRERKQGKLEGRIWRELQQELKSQLAVRDSLNRQERTKFRFDPSYENDEELVGRMLTFLREVSVAHLGKNILAVSHGGIMRALLVHLGFAAYPELPTESIKNSGYVVLRSDGTDFFIEQTVGINKKFI